MCVRIEGLLMPKQVSKKIGVANGAKTSKGRFPKHKKGQRMKPGIGTKHASSTS
jgi:hypothetical protein